MIDGQRPASAMFELEHGHGPMTCVVRLSGDIDMAVVPVLREYLDEALRDGCLNLVLDLADVMYADSSALGLLVWLDHRLRPAGGTLVLAGANRDVTRVLELSGLMRVAASVKASPNVEAALEGLELPELAAEPLWVRAITVPSDPDRLAGVRDEFSTLVAPLGFPESALFDMKVALGEALANAVRHGRPSTGEAIVSLVLTAYPDRVMIDITDNGPGFDGVPPDGGDVYAPGGRGVMFMRALMDRVEFLVADEGGTHVRLVKHRTGGVPAV